MVNQDIITGLRNAIQRGYSLDMAKSSFINAGYPKKEVEEAASQFTQTSLHLSAHENSLNTKIPIAGENPEEETKKEIKVQIRKKFDKKIVLLVVLLILLIGGLAASIIFQKVIMEFFQNTLNLG